MFDYPNPLFHSETIYYLVLCCFCVVKKVGYFKGKINLLFSNVISERLVRDALHYQLQ